MTRATDNRQHQIAQGLAFLSQYRAIKGRCQEVEYNFGRVFHLLDTTRPVWRSRPRTARLGCTSMVMTRRTRTGEDDFTRVAAYNLSNLYMLSGEPDLAKVIAHKWLSF
ncbi:BZ3501_MvSof-1269-A2-R1_Chr5-1g07383 [Microbotryum saponariae]|nr:BZ3501_MvSof-1269-A2-R1_Chr5-1g07383 [Microbotryum saponariae]